MTTELFAVAPDTGLESLKRELVTRKISGAPVVRSDGSPCGVVSVSDLADPERDSRHRVGYDVYYEFTGRRAVEAGADLPDDNPGRVEDVMSHEVIAVLADDRVEDAATLMLEKSVHRVLVCDAGKLVGVVSSHDLLRALLGKGE